MKTKLDADVMYTVMGINDNEREPGGINKDNDVTDDQESKVIFTNTNVTDADTDTDVGLNNHAILKQINDITETQDNP